MSNRKARRNITSLQLSSPDMTPPENNYFKCVAGNVLTPPHTHSLWRNRAREGLIFSLYGWQLKATGPWHKHIQAPIHPLSVWSAALNSGRHVTAAERGEETLEEEGGKEDSDSGIPLRSTWPLSKAFTPTPLLCEGGAPCLLLLLIFLPKVKGSRMWRWENIHGWHFDVQF